MKTFMSFTLLSFLVSLATALGTYTLLKKNQPSYQSASAVEAMLKQREQEKTVLTKQLQQKHELMLQMQDNVAILQTTLQTLQSEVQALKAYQSSIDIESIAASSAPSPSETDTSKSQYSLFQQAQADQEALDNTLSESPTETQQSDYKPDPYLYLEDTERGETQYITDILLNENVDPEWAYEMEENLVDHFHQTDLPLDIQDITCRSSFCKLEIRQGNDDVTYDLVKALHEPTNQNEPSPWQNIQDSLGLNNVPHRSNMALDEFGYQVLTYFIARDEETEIPSLRSSDFE